MASLLPDELWSLILELGVSASILTHRDLCSLAIASRRLRRLSSQAALWSALLSRDFPSASSSSSDETPAKSLYQSLSERAGAARLLCRRRALLDAESQVALCKHEIRELEAMLVQERDRLSAAAGELSNLERARSAAVALNVWQPEVVRGRQKEIVEQCTVPVESRLNTLKMEIRVCKQQIAVYMRRYDKKKRRLSECEERLASLKYHPLQDCQVEAKTEVGSSKQKRFEATN